MFKDKGFDRYFQPNGFLSRGLSRARTGKVCGKKEESVLAVAVMLVGKGKRRHIVHPVHKKFSVKVVYFVLKNNREKTFRLYFDIFSLARKSLHRHGRRTFYLAPQPL
jgi:hypothetical protein